MEMELYELVIFFYFLTDVVYSLTRSSEGCSETCKPGVTSCCTFPKALDKLILNSELICFFSGESWKGMDE